MKRVTPADQMRATGTGRRKVALPAGRSQLDWVRNSARIIARSPRTVSMRELRAHSTKHDAWIAINAQVFDVTPYVEYHPGGIDILVAVAGKDATKLFNKYHAWVNVQFMLKNCYVGMLDDSDRHEFESEEDDDESDEDCEQGDGPVHEQASSSSARALSG